MSSRSGFGVNLTDYIKVNPRNAQVAEVFHEPAYVCRATQRTPRLDLLLPGEPVSIDIEFQNFRRKGGKGRHRCGRTGLVNTRNEVILDVYAAYPRAEGERKFMPPEKYMVDKRDLLYENGAMPAQQVEAWVKEIVKNRKVIMHGGTNDLTAFQYETDVWAASEIIDTQREYSYLQDDGTPGLQTCADFVLHKTVQEGDHLATEDAQTAMELFLRKYPNAFDAAAAKAEVARCQEQAIYSDEGTSDQQSTNVVPLKDPGTGRKDRKHEAQFTPRRRKHDEAHGGSTATALHGRAVNIVKQPTGENTQKAEAFKLSIEDDAAFPALGAVVPGVSRR